LASIETETREENIAVEADLSVDGGEGRTETHLVTTEDGNWVVFT
jgi:hypothetical protein